MFSFPHLHYEIKSLSLEKETQVHSHQRKFLKLFHSKQFYTSLQILSQKFFTMRGSSKSWAETKLGNKTDEEQPLFLGPGATILIFGRTCINLLSICHWRFLGIVYYTLTASLKTEFRK